MSLEIRPPIIAIMGHVDHGKTSLLDAIRKANVAAKEAGGITQHIGAYQIEHAGRKLTFLDTPGHAAFAKMRSRGARVTDIVILVVAADDGVMPQTIESIEHIKNSGVQYLVAINKMDSPNANPMHVKSQLAEHEVFVEGFGGNISVVEVSAKTKQGIPELLDMLLLMADVSEFKADNEAPFEGVIIESGKDAHRGVVATILVKQGTLKVKTPLFTQDVVGKVRNMTDASGKQVMEALPACPVAVVGFEAVPEVGSLVKDVFVVKEEKTADIAASSSGEKLKFILKTDVAGSLEALQQSLPPEVELISSSTGDVNDSDVLLAETVGAKIIGFNVRANAAVMNLAEAHDVRIKTYRIIYELLEDLEKQVEFFKNPGMDEEVLGTAEVIAEFNMKGEKIAGCKVMSGEIKRGQNIFYHLKRGEQIVIDPKVKSLKQSKTDVEVVKSPGECGIVFRAFSDFKIGDTLICFTKKEVI